MIQSSESSRPNNLSVRSFISLAALLVKVSARIDHGLTPQFSIRFAIRYVRTRVLPLPAPARTSRGPSAVVTASRCSSLRRFRLSIQISVFIMNLRQYRACQEHLQAASWEAQDSIFQIRCRWFRKYIPRQAQGNS